MKKKINIFNFDKAGEGIEKNKSNRGVRLYFELLQVHFWKLTVANLLFLIASIPAIIIGWIFSVGIVSWIATQVKINVSEVSYALHTFSIISTGCLIVICGSGPASVSMNVIMNGFVNDIHVWMWSDFKIYFKENFAKGIIVYLVNMVVIVFSIVAFLFYNNLANGVIANIMKILLIFLLLTFTMMQPYLYQLIGKYKANVKQAYHDAFLLVFVKLPWNILCFVSTGIITYIGFDLAVSLPGIGSLPIVFIYFSLIDFTRVFMTNFVLKIYLKQ